MDMANIGRRRPFGDLTLEKGCTGMPLTDDGPLDCLVIGAGPAGLTAGIYLGRCRRRFLVVDGGSSRAAWIPRSPNTPGFPDGLGGNALPPRRRRPGGASGPRPADRRA